MTPAGKTPRERLQDVVAVALLVAVVLLGLDGSYATRSFLVLGLGSAAAAGVVVLLAVPQGRGAEVVLPGWVVLFALVGAVPTLVATSFAPGSVAGALGAVLPDTITAPATLLGTIPPVDPSATTLMIPHAIGFLAGGALWIALASRRPLAPVVPLLVADALVILVGTPDPALLVVRALGFAVVATWWVTSRGKRTSGVEHAQRGRLLRAAGGLALVAVAAAVTSYVVPASAQDRVVLRGRVGTGEDVSQLDNPLGTFRKFTPQPAGTQDNVAGKRLLRVSGLPRGALLRFVALDSYRDQAWRAGNRTVPDDASDLFQRIGSQVAVARRGTAVTVDVQVRAYRSSWLPLPGQLRSVSFDFLDGDAQRDDVRYNPATTTAMVVGGLSAQDDYTVRGVLPDTTLSRRMETFATDGPLQPEGAFLDRYLAPWRQASLTPLGRVYSLAAYLRKNGRYSDGATQRELVYRPGQDEGRLGEGFIGATVIVGDDEQYAAFVALAANRLGVPARVALGARPGKGGWVRGRDVEAWVEIRVADGSWRILPTSRFMSHKKPSGLDAPQSPQAFIDQSTPQPDDNADQQPADQDRQPSKVDRDGRAPAGLLVPGLVLLVLLVLAAVPAAKLARRARRRRAPRPSARVVGAWAELLDLAHDAGVPAAPGALRRPQAAALGVDPGLAEEADRLVFGPAPPTDAEAAAFWRACAAERRALRARLSLVRRVRATWSPASLAGSARRALAGHPRRGLPLRLRRAGA